MMDFIRDLNWVDRLFIVLMASFVVLLVVVILISVHRSNQEENWCKAHGLGVTGGGHSPILCYDLSTGMVRKPLVTGK